MAIDIFAHLLEFVLGPIFLLLYLPELNVALGDVSQLLNMVIGGNVNEAITQILDGQFDVGTRTLSALIGTVVWVAVAASVVGEVGELGGAGELLELFE
jgi:hypothetical protein